MAHALGYELSEVLRKDDSDDKVGMIVVIAVMAVTAIGCFVRDRLELV